jgi:hypothetical protein
VHLTLTLFLIPVLGEYSNHNSVPLLVFCCRHLVITIRRCLGLVDVGGANGAAALDWVPSDRQGVPGQAEGRADTLYNASGHVHEFCAQLSFGNGRQFKAMWWSIVFSYPCMITLFLSSSSI